MTQVQAEVRRQQRLEELCAASLRALTGLTGLQYRGHQLYDGARRVPLGAPHLRADPATDDLPSLRGAADGVAMRLIHSDAPMHADHMPDSRVARLLFEMLEQYRCESLADWPGVRANMRHRHEVWSQAWHDAGLNDSAGGLMLYTIAQISRSRITGEPVPEATEGLMEGVRADLTPELGHHLAGLRRDRHDQHRFAVHARALAEQVALLVEETLADDRQAQQGRVDARQTPYFAMWVDDGDDADGTSTPGTGTGTGTGADVKLSEEAYRAFTTEFDREVRAGSLVRAARLQECRTQLDERVTAQAAPVARLARELKALLASAAEDGWDGAQEEGQLDGRRLSQLICQPAERRLFRRPHMEPMADAAVTLLVDCSGSMKVHAESVALLSDVLIRALDQAGVPCELLGFTTGAWNGGRVVRQWRQAGCPARPGRLNELQHLVFKTFDQPWRRARPDIAAMLEAHLFREGVDGEAVDWACSRLLKQEARVHLLIVISDGCPTDTATQQANVDQYLDQHLREVVARRQAQDGVRIAGLGLGLDLSPYYEVNRVIEIDARVRNQVFGEVLALVRAGLTGRAARSNLHQLFGI